MSLEGDVVAGYVFGPVLGEGAFGQVRVCMDIRTGGHFAVKIMEKSRTRGFETKIQLEIEIQRNLSSTGGRFVKLVGQYNTRTRCYLFLELAMGGDLFKKLQTSAKGVTEGRLGEILYDIASSINTMHDAGYVHRDIKLDNVMFESNVAGSRVILGDFGLSTRCNIANSDGLHKTCGTPVYMAPEILNGCGYGVKVDVWALGVTAFTLLLRRYPWKGDTDPEALHEVQHLAEGFLDSIDMCGISSTARSFIECCLAVDPSKRLTAKRALEHPFLRSGKRRDESEKRTAAIAASKLNEVAKNIKPNAVVGVDGAKDEVTHARAVAPHVAKKVIAVGPPGKAEIDELEASWKHGYQKRCGGDTTKVKALKKQALQRHITKVKGLKRQALQKAEVLKGMKEREQAAAKKQQEVEEAYKRKIRAGRQ